MSYRLGIDLGASSAKVALVNSAHRVIKEGTVVTSGFPKPAHVAQQLALVCRQLVGNKPIRHVGVGVAGDIDFDRGIVRLSPNLGWKNVPLKKLIQKFLRCRIVVDNDANVAAWGIYKTQVNRQVKNLLAVTLGTGVGGGVILDGKMHRGKTGSAGEIGHMTIDENGPVCNCGNRGCLETYVGAPYMVKYVKQLLDQGERSSLETIYRENPERLSSIEFSKAAQAGDALAISIWERSGHALGVALSNFIYLFNPELICLTGGVAQAKQLILNPLRRTMARRAFQTPIRAAQIKIGANAAHIGVVGASLL